MDEYIIVNKTKLNRKIAQLRDERNMKTEYINMDGIEAKILENIVKNSAELIPIVDNAYEAGMTYISPGCKEDYINNLKLTI